MKKNYFILFLLLFTKLLFAQTSTELFETESYGSTSFTDNGVIFNIISHSGSFNVQANFPGSGWSGTATDNRYIDNTVFPGSNSSFSIKTTSNLFKVNRFWVFLSNTSLDLNVPGSLTITGKSNGITKFTQTKTTGFSTSIGTTNGYTLIDLTNLNGQNYSNIIIDELQITTGGRYAYASLDAFTWVKDSSLILPTCLTFSSQPISSIICAGSPATFFASASNATSYQWQVNTGSGFTNISNDATYSGATTQILIINGVTTGMNEYEYQVVASGSCGASATSSSAALNVYSAPAITAQPNNSAICTGANTTFSVSASYATAYQWQVDTGSGFTNVSNGAPYSGVTSATLTITGATAEMNGYIYRAVATGICSPAASSNTAALTVNHINVALTKIDVKCFGDSTGQATATATNGTGSYTYFWAPSGGTAATATELAAGTYTVTVTDGNACETKESITITQPAALKATATAQTNIACNRDATGSATVLATGGTGAYTYSWSPSGGTAPTASGLTAGTYTVTVTDENQCFTTQGFTISQTTALSATTASTGVSCFGGSNGTASVTVSGGTPNYTYSWAPLGGTASFISGRPAGNYTCTITDANGCTLTQTITISSPSQLYGTIAKVDVSCNGGSNGSATVTPSGGVGSYTYLWSPRGGNAATASGLAQGTYTVTIQDGNTCEATVSVTIDEPALFTLSLSKTDVLCNGGATGTATATPAGGNGSYTYVWSPSGGTAATATGLTPGNYSCTVTDAKGCFVWNTVTIAEPAILSATTSQIDATCSTAGQASVNVSGGVGPYSYRWSSGQTSALVTGLTAGSYSCNITDANLCTISKNVTINTTNTLVAATSQNDVSCNGANTGSATVIPSGAPGPFTYVWAPSGGSNATASNLTAGNYSVTITSANGCSIIKNFTITEPSALAVTPSQTNLLCHGGTTGSASVVVTGGTGSYTYSWAPSGGTAATATGLTAGTYVVTINDGNLCPTTQSFTIAEPNAFTATIGSTNVSCNGGSNGSATVTATGGTGTYTYSWSPSGGTAATATGLSAGTYAVTVTDVNSCTTTESITITEPAALVATTSQSNVSCNGGSNGSATVNVTGGSGTYTYSWAPSGGTAATATGLSPGTYTATVTDANSCTTTQNFTIVEPTPLIASATGQTNVSCNGGTNGSVTVTATGGTGTYTYSWSPSGGTAATATGLGAGTYTAIVTDANNCTATQSFTITEPAVLAATISQTNVSCNGGSNGSASVNVTGGTGTYTYVWAPSGGTAGTATGLSAGTYAVTVTDANSCTTTQSITITEPTPLVASVGAHNNVTCNGLNNGSATVTATGGTGSYTYSWSPSGGTAATATGLSPGTYTVTVTDAKSCTATQSFTIIEPIPLTASATSQTDVSCNGGTNGSVTVTATGGTGTYTYSWSPSGGTAATATGLGAGTYTAIVTDANNCTATQSFTITEPNALIVTIAPVNVSCNGGSNGSATVAATGGTGSYTYSWSPSGGTAATATGLGAGTYTAIVTDANNCTATQSFTITEPSALIATIAPLNVSCNGGSNGSATATVTGGTGTYTYIWAPSGGTAAAAIGLSAGTYAVTVTDANSCTTTQSITITEPTPLVASVGAHNNVTCNGLNNGSATVTATGGTGSYTYSWSPSGGTAATATGLSPGTYTVTVTDAKSCTATQSFTIIEPIPLTASATSQTDVSCNGGTNGSATVTATGGTGTYTYSWSPTGGTDATATGLSPGIYTATITDANNCTATQSFTIIEPSVLTASASGQTNVSCHGGNTGSATVTATGGTGTYTYSWSPTGGTDATASNLIAGTYSVTVTDANSCTATQSFTIVEPLALEVVSTQKNVTCYNANNGEATVAISGGIPPYSYKWSNSDSTNQTAKNLVTGNYICTITDSNNCIINQSFTITQPTNPIDLVASLPAELTASSVALTINASRNGINGDQGECTSEIGLVFSTVSNPTINDSKIILGSNLGTFTKVIEALLGNTVYYLRPYAIGKFGYINYGNEISFTTQKYVLNVVATSDQTKVFGNTEPILTYVATGFANGDNNSIITGLLSRDAGENAGTYPITLGSLSGGTNYTIDFETSEFKITKANQIIDWNQELAFGCDTSDQLQLNAFSDSGLPLSYVVENSSIADVQGDILKINSPGTTTIIVSQEGDQNYNAASQITKSIEVSQFGNISQHWEDVLFFDNSSQKYSAFQWYKDGAIIPGANSQYYTEKPLKGIYSLQAKDENGKDIKFCPLTLAGQSFSRAIKLYPNPVQSLEEFAIESDYSAEQLKGSVINIYDLSGKLVTTVNNVSSKVVVLAPSSSGIYVVILSLANGQHKTVNLLVR